MNAIRLKTDYLKEPLGLGNPNPLSMTYVDEVYVYMEQYRKLLKVEQNAIEVL